MEKIVLLEKFNYPDLYCNFVHQGFLDSLELTYKESRILALVSAQVEPEGRPCYVSKLTLEKLVEDPTAQSYASTPYEALRTLHKLKDIRVLSYELSEEVERPKLDVPAQIVDKAMDIVIDPNDLSAKEKYTSLNTEIKRKKNFERYALLNVEYPVIYTCMQEEYNLSPDINTNDLSLIYTAIRQGNLANALVNMGYTAMLEFLNYIQSIVNQPLTHQPLTHQVLPKTPPEDVQEPLPVSDPSNTTKAAEEATKKWLEEQSRRQEAGEIEVEDEDYGV